MKKGFTLVELMAVIIIISLIAILTFPNIINQIKKTKKSNNKMVEDLVLTQAKKYVSDNPSEFEDNEYCIGIDALLNNDYIKDGIVKNSDIIDKKVIFLSNDNYKLVDKDKCKANNCKRDYCDDEGNGYTNVNFLMSMGEQYIDTGFKPNQDTKVEMDFSTITSQTEMYFGSRDRYDINTFAFLQDNNGLRSDYGAQVGNKITMNGSRFKVSKDKNITTINDATTSSLTYNNFTNNYNMYIFAINEKNSPLALSKMILYSFKIYDNDSLVRDYTPVKDDNNVGCLFDKIGRRCYYNLGDGELKYSSYQDNNNVFYEVDYLESTGTQYINTGVNSTSSITLDTTIKGDYTNVTWYGARDNNYIGIFNYSGRFDYVGIDNNSVNPTANNWHKISHGKKLVIDDVLIKTYSDMTYETNRPIFLFAGNNNGNVGLFSSIKMKKTTIKSGGAIIRDFIPVLDKNNRPCLYDKIEKKCYYNQGTGEFLYG